ncbi:MAG: AgmX/PglI C-terminal domain-containing protein [Polyangia bacterium]
MKFLCDSCGTKYSIADERVKGRVLKIRCKKCDFVITVREEISATAATEAVPTGAGEVAMPQSSQVLDESTMLGELPLMVTAPTPTPTLDDWFLSFDGEQEGPFSLARAHERLRANHADNEVHAWRPGFLVWLPAEEVPELSTKERVNPPLPVLPNRRPVAAITKDPSGPRAALSVSAGARPAIPLAARAPAIPAAALPEAAPGIQSMFGGQNAEDPPSLDGSALEPDEDDDGYPGEEGSPDLNISNEASGLVNLAHLAAAHMGQKPAGPIFMNGHTARAPKLAPEHLADLDAPLDARAPAPVVVVASAAPSSAPLFKYITILAIPILLGLGGTVIYLLTHRPPAETIIVTEPSRHVDDSTIVLNDSIARGVASDPKHPNSGGKKSVGVTHGAAPGVTGKGAGESGATQARNELYREGGDEITPHGVPGIAGHHDQPGGQVSQAAIIGVVNSNKRMLTLCYERALKNDASLKSGRVPIHVAVGLSGRVQNVSIVGAQYATSELGQCFVQAVKRWSFPASEAAYETEFPFILQGQ